MLRPAALVLVALAFSPFLRQDAVHAPLQSAARALAKANRPAETAEVLTLVAGVNYPADALVKLKSACDADLVKPNKSPQASLAEASRQLKTACASIQKAFPAAEGEPRRNLAQLWLAIDGNAAPARAELGYEKVNGVWLRPQDRALRERRAAIADALRAARHISVELDVSASQDPVFRAAYAEGGVRVKWKGVNFHTFWSAEKASRVLRETLRALALSNFLRTGNLAVPEGLVSNWIHVDTPQAYSRAVEAGRQAKFFSDTDAKHAAALDGYYVTDAHFGVQRDLIESQTAGILVKHMSVVHYEQPCLSGGHLNWICLAYLGTPLSGTAWVELEPNPAANAGTAVDDPEANAERQALLRLSRAGIAGCRAWMAYLAARREDPPWSRSMVETLGKITGQDLLKCTSVVEYLQELGPLDTLFRDADPDNAVNSQKDRTAVMARVLKSTLPEFENAWREWILFPKRGLLEKLDEREDKVPLPKGAAEVVAELNALRLAALGGKPGIGDTRVVLDKSLSEGARLHSHYLGKNPGQAAAWPDAHEEYPDKEGFTADGALAGTHAVIAPGVSTGKDALDAWMATFYHRLPLLEPGLQRVGWSLEQKFAVLDVASMSAPSEHSVDVPWPPDGRRDVPTNFRPELPNPVPDADQSRFGYPVTLQACSPDAAKYGTDVQLRLLQGDTGGAEVDCYFTSPAKPLNPLLAPENAFCLIPKAPLKPKTLYTAVATWPLGGKTLRWSFTTK